MNIYQENRIKLSIGNILIDGNSYGTAWIALNGYALTAAHCVINLKTKNPYADLYQIKFPFGVIIAKLIDWDILNDCAIMHLPDPNITNLNALELGYDFRHIGASWWAYGYPSYVKGENPSGFPLTGTIISNDSPIQSEVGEVRVLQLSCPGAAAASQWILTQYGGNIGEGVMTPLRGISGAPVIDVETQRVIGLIRKQHTKYGPWFQYATRIQDIVAIFQVLREARENSIKIEKRAGKQDFAKMTSLQLDQVSAIEKIRRLSSVAARDAGFIIDDPNSPGDEIRLEDNLYVKRVIEKDIFNLFNTKSKGDFPFLMVVGEAGFGKTSLLWQIHRTMEDEADWEPWFIKSTFLMRYLSDGGIQRAEPNLNLRELNFAVDLIKSKGKKPIILLDTADILLGNENDRYFLIDIISSLREYGCAIIVTTRPQEARYLRLLELHRIDLRDYNDQELEDAVNSHVNRFYAHSELRDLSEHVNRIRNAVFCGLPIRDVCTNPLTLRMLFVLYAPEEVSLEINVFKLYEDFWDKRVIEDLRAGSPYPQQRKGDLSGTASAIALIMLAEGSPEIDERIVKKILPDMGDIDEEINYLVSRGIIHRSEGRTIRFFHQTFFEHSAARGLLARFQGNSIQILEDRMKTHPNDLFVNPILEHLLLLCESTASFVREKAEYAFKKLLSDPSILARNSAIYIYTHQQNVSKGCLDVIGDILPTEDTAIIIRFLSIAHNMPQQRLIDLLKNLDTIWLRHKWEEQCHILELLERVATRNPVLAMDFIRRHKLLDIAPQMSPDGYRSLFKTIRVLAAREFKLCNFVTIQKMIDILTISSNPNLHICILETLCELTKLPGMEEIPEICDKFLLTPESGKIKVEEASWLGCLFAEGCRLSPNPLSRIISKVKNANGFLLKCYLYGLSGVLLTTDINEQEAEKIWQIFLNESVSKQWEWTSIVFPRLIRGTTENHRHSVRVQPITRYFRGFIKNILEDYVTTVRKIENTSGDKAIISIKALIIKSIVSANLPPDELLEMINCKSLLSVKLWLSEDGFGALFAEAYYAGHTGATSAMLLLVQSPMEYPANLVSCVASRLSQKLNLHDEILESVIILHIKTGNGKGLNKIFETNRKIDFEVIFHLHKELSELRQGLINSISGIKRRRGVRLWINLLRNGLDVPPSFDELLKLMDSESDQQTFAWLTLLFGPSSIRGGYDDTEVINVLLPYCMSSDINLRTKSLEGLFEAITQSPGPKSTFAIKMLEAALHRPTDSNRLSYIGDLIEILITENIDTSVFLLEKLLIANETHELGHQAKRYLITCLRKPVRSLFHACSTSSRKHLINLVPDVDHFMGRILVDAACHESFSEIIPLLDKMLSNPVVDSKIKELIRRHKHQRERTTGGGSWPELYDICLLKK